MFAGLVYPLRFANRIANDKPGYCKHDSPWGDRLAYGLGRIAVEASAVFPRHSRFEFPDSRVHTHSFHFGMAWSRIDSAVTGITIGNRNRMGKSRPMPRLLGYSDLTLWLFLPMHKARNSRGCALIPAFPRTKRQ